MSPECAPSSQKLSRYLSTDDLRIQVIFTTRKQAFNDAQTMTLADRGRALVRALKNNVNFAKFKE